MKKHISNDSILVSTNNIFSLDICFLERGIPNATIQMTMKDKLINVIIMNEKFEYLGETTLGTGKEWNWANSFVTEEGLNIEYLDKNDLDENYLIFKILTLKKLS